MQAQRVAHHLRHDDVTFELLDAEEEQRDPQRGQRMLHERVQRRAAAAPSHGPTYGMSSVMPAQTPKSSAYLPPFGISPTTPSIQMPKPALTPMITESASCPFT